MTSVFQIIIYIFNTGENTDGNINKNHWKKKQKTEGYKKYNTELVTL